MQKKSFGNSTAAYALLAMILMLTDCSSKKSSEPATSSDGGIAYEAVEDKTAVAKLYELDHLKEWYPERVLPPTFDFSVDLSTKSVTELWLLRNEIFARNGYLFDDAVLRGHFSQFKWYQPIFDVPEFKVPLNKQEQEFVNKVIVRENELRAQRLTTQNGYTMIHTDHIYNLLQFKEVPQALKDQLARTNFAIVPARHEQLFHVYDENHYQYIPSFITTDLYLQVLHKHFSSILRKVEETKLTPLLTQLLYSIYAEAGKIGVVAQSPEMKRAAAWTTTYMAIAYTLLTGKVVAVPEEMSVYYKSEINKVQAAEETGSEFLQSSLLAYSQFKPRGNYTSTPELENYFRCVKWLNTAPFFIGEDDGLLAATILASIIKRSSSDLAAFQKFCNAIQFIVGEEDNLSLSHLVNSLSAQGADDPSTMDAAQLASLRKKLEDIDPDRIRPQMASLQGKEVLKPKLLFTAGRYTFDAEILSKLVHVLRPDPRRPFPKGLDVFAVLGSKEAENILINEYKEAQSWRDYPMALASLQNQFATFNDWNKNIYSKSMEAIQSLRVSDERHPLFMKTPSWERKNLITSLAAWTELKHDMLLYAEQPYAAQAGEGGGPPPPQHIGYVEPNMAFWTKALELLALQEKTLEELNLMTEGIQRISDELREIGNFLLTVSEKELRGVPLTADEFDDISWMGGKIEYLTFKIFDSDHLPEKERLVAVVADVYRNNGTYLEEATGLADEVYVVVEINGKPHLTRGTVFSYYEFNASGAPLTDEQWQQQLLSGKSPIRPTWTNGITVRTKSLESKEAYSLLGAGFYY